MKERNGFFLGWEDPQSEGDDLQYAFRGYSAQHLLKNKQRVKVAVFEIPDHPDDSSSSSDDIYDDDDDDRDNDDRKRPAEEESDGNAKKLKPSSGSA